MYIPDLREERIALFKEKHFDYDQEHLNAGGEEQLQAYYERLMQIKDQWVLATDEYEAAKLAYETTPDWGFVSRAFRRYKMNEAKVKMDALEAAFNRYAKEYEEVTSYYEDVEGKTEKTSFEGQDILREYGVYIGLGVVGLIIVSKILK